MRLTNRDQARSGFDAILRDYVGHYVVLSYLGEQDINDQYRAARMKAVADGNATTHTVPVAVLAAIAQFDGENSPATPRILGRTAVYGTVIAQQVRDQNPIWGKLERTSQQNGSTDRDAYLNIIPVADDASPSAAEVLSRFQTLWPEDNPEVAGS